MIGWLLLVLILIVPDVSEISVGLFSLKQEVIAEGEKTRGAVEALTDAIRGVYGIVGRQAGNAPALAKRWAADRAGERESPVGNEGDEEGRATAALNLIADAIIAASETPPSAGDEVGEEDNQLGIAAELPSRELEAAAPEAAADQDAVVPSTEAPRTTAAAHVPPRRRLLGRRTSK